MLKLQSIFVLEKLSIKNAFHYQSMQSKYFGELCLCHKLCILYFFKACSRHKKMRFVIDYGSVWIPLIAENWKHYSKIIFKCVNSAVEPSFKIVFAKKSICGSRKQYTRSTKNAERWKLLVFSNIQTCTMSITITMRPTKTSWVIFSYLFIFKNFNKEII